MKSAWFLLWIQEVVSYSKYLINLVIAGTACAFLLPWLPRVQPAEKAEWFPRDQRVVTAVALAAFAAIMVLTLVAMFFRGENWSLVIPF